MAQYPPISLMADASSVTDPGFATFTFSSKFVGSTGEDTIVNNIGPYVLLPFLCSKHYHIGEKQNDRSAIADEDIGLSTVAVQAGDEIWQFPGTLFALVVSTSHNFALTIVGRARMLSPMGLDGTVKVAGLPYDNQNPFENGASHKNTSRSFPLTYRQLFTLTLLTALPTIWH